MAACVIRTTGSNLVGGTLDEGGLDAFGDHFTSCLLNHPHTAVVVGTILPLIVCLFSLSLTLALTASVCW